MSFMPNAPLKVFLVEDSQALSSALAETLSELAHADIVGRAATERAASNALVHSDDWELAIVDLTLAEGTGMGVLEELEACGDKRPRVLFTNYATPDVRRRALECGAQAVFDKSREIDELIDYCSVASAIRRPG